MEKDIIIFLNLFILMVKLKAKLLLMIMKTMNYLKVNIKKRKYNGKLRTYFDSINYELKREVEIKNGKIEGKGKEYYGNKRLKYVGNYKEWKYNGNGILNYEFFGYIKYSGEFKDGKKNGFGKEFDKRGNLVYQGKYFQDKRI